MTTRAKRVVRLGAIALGVAAAAWLVVEFLDAQYERTGPMVLKRITDIPDIGPLFAGLQTTGEIRHIEVRTYRTTERYIAGRATLQSIESWVKTKKLSVWRETDEGAQDVIREIDPEAAEEWQSSYWAIRDNPQTGVFLFFVVDPSSGRFWCYALYGRGQRPGPGNSVIPRLMPLYAGRAINARRRTNVSRNFISRGAEYATAGRYTMATPPPAAARVTVETGTVMLSFERPQHAPKQPVWRVRTIGATGRWRPASPTPA